MVTDFIGPEIDQMGSTLKETLTADAVKISLLFYLYDMKEQANCR